MGDDGLPSAVGTGVHRGKLESVVKLAVAKQIMGSCFRSKRKRFSFLFFFF